MFQRALISKVVNAGIVSPMSYQTWKTLSEKSGGQFISRIPLLPEMEHPGEWLEFFRQTAPDNLLERVLFQNRFEEAGVPFDEKLVFAAFPAKETPQKQKK